MSSAVKHVKVVDKLPSFARQLRNAYDDALSEVAKDILIASRNVAPFQKGALRRESDTSQVRLLLWRVSYWIEYARYQEFGGDEKRTVRNYSTAGTGKHFLQKTGDDRKSRMVITLKKHGSRARV